MELDIFSQIPVVVMIDFKYPCTFPYKIENTLIKEKSIGNEVIKIIIINMHLHIWRHRRHMTWRGTIAIPWRGSISRVKWGWAAISVPIVPLGWAPRPGPSI